MSSSAKRSFPSSKDNAEASGGQAKKPRPSASIPSSSSSSSTPLASSSRQPPAAAPTRGEVQLGKGTTLNKAEKALRKKQMEEDRLAAKPSISRWDAPPAPSTSSDPKKERDKEKARLKREKEKKEKIEREREKAEVEGGKGRGLIGWVVRKKE